MSGDQQVQRADRLTGFAQSGTQAAVGRGGVGRIVQHLQRRHELEEELMIVLGMRTVFGAETELRKGNRRNPGVTDPELFKTLQNMRGLFSDKVNADVGDRKSTRL